MIRISAAFLSQVSHCPVANRCEKNILLNHIQTMDNAMQIDGKVIPFDKVLGVW